MAKSACEKAVGGIKWRRISENISKNKFPKSVTVIWRMADFQAGRRDLMEKREVRRCKFTKKR